MNMVNIIFIILIAVALFFAARAWKRVKKKGCGGCNGNCASCKNQKK